MTHNRLLVHSCFLLLLPVVVAALGIGTLGAVLLVVFTLVWRWLITLSGFAVPAKVPELELETITASHFVEKVRWCMDRLGVDYVERQSGGTLGVFFRGRTVPLLKMQTGAVRSSIGNSPEILRYLWGRYGRTLGERAAFLEPTAERVALESRIDRCGANLQVWIYYHILPHRDLTLHVWGVSNPAIPAWQRLALTLLFPLQRALIRRAFRISDAHYATAVTHIEALLADIEKRLGDGRLSILGGDDSDYVDMSFAAIFGLYLQPARYGGGKADAVRVERDEAPSRMRDDIERWIANYPRANGFIERLYAQQRQATAAVAV